MKLWFYLTLIGFGFIYAAIWARWLLEDRLLQTGLLTLLLAAVLYVLDHDES
ncbi:hypothetical protein LCGC14_0397320 [marine sediment metagenome]|uniref:Uncharacterized protein n=1 Tax=marine sediment metagenome TaxID=412755 RepID=A0A0F9T3P3_9ZZZZ